MHLRLNREMKKFGKSLIQFAVYLVLDVLFGWLFSVLFKMTDTFDFWRLLLMGSLFSIVMLIVDALFNRRKK